MIGKTILHYKIIEKLGEGGMGIVYLAEDSKLKRQVAIKFLPQNISANSEEKKRFEIEAQAAAALNHPNIATIHAIEEYDDEMFIVMEYIQGQELKAAVGAIGSVAQNLDIIIGYAIQIASGLQAAHEKGIVHRDIKPSNIMITDNGQVKIMDFGLAKVGEGVQLTKEQSTIGTAAYMSPEQTKGEILDHRSDIWSLGVVLYELLAGKLPFGGAYDQAIIYSILNDQPAMAEDVPNYLKIILDKLLNKNIEERYQNSTELISDLKSKKAEKSDQNMISNLVRKKSPYIYTGLVLMVVIVFSWIYLGDDNNVNDTDASVKMKRIAVLPFTNIKNDPESDFLGFALADQIIGSLSYLQNILVRPSSSIRHYQDTMIDVQTAGNDLNVDVVLAGNFLKEANQIRLNIELVDISTNNIIWREPIEIEYINSFALQDIVTKKVIDRLRVQFSKDERDRMQNDIPQNPLAYDYYLRSISYPSTTEGELLAIEMLKKSIELDSTYAPAFAEIGRRRHRYANYGLGGETEIIKAERDYQKALRLNKDLLAALWNLATLYTESNKTFEAVGLAEKILDINPNSAWAHFNLGYVFRYVGMLEESEEEYEKALTLDPGNPRFRSAGLTYVSLGKYEEAFRAYDLDKGSSLALFSYGDIMFTRNRMEEAVAYYNAVLDQEPTGVFYYSALAMKLIIDKNYLEATKALKQFEDKNPPDGELWFSMSRRYALAGDVTSCVRTLEQAIDRGYFNYPYIQTDLSFDPVRNGKEYQRVLLKAKNKHEEFKQKYYQNRVDNPAEN